MSTLYRFSKLIGFVFFLKFVYDCFMSSKLTGQCFGQGKGLGITLYSKLNTQAVSFHTNVQRGHTSTSKHCLLASPSTSQEAHYSLPGCWVCAELAGQSTVLLAWILLGSFRYCQPLANPGLEGLLAVSAPRASNFFHLLQPTCIP